MSLASRKVWPQKRGRSGSTGRLDPVDVHVLEPGLRFVAAWAHLVVGDALRRPPRAVSRRRCQAGSADAQVLVEPPVGSGPSVPGCQVNLPPTKSSRHRGADDAGADVGVLGGQPVLPDVGGLDDVVVDRDDLRQLAMGRSWVRGTRASVARADGPSDVGGGHPAPRLPAGPAPAPQPIATPPLGLRHWPVTKLAASEAR